MRFTHAMNIRLFLRSSGDGKIIPNDIIYSAAINQMRIKRATFCVHPILVRIRGVVVCGAFGARLLFTHDVCTVATCSLLSILTRF